MADYTITEIRAADNTRGRNYPIGENVAPGDVVYVSNADGLLYKASCDSVLAGNEAGAMANALGVIYGTGVFPGFALAVFGSKLIIVTAQTFTLGIPVVLSSTPGKLAPIGDLVATNWLTEIGKPVDANTLNIQIDVTGTQMGASICP